MMGIQPSEAKALTWWEYQALLWNWNDRHTIEENEPAEPADPAFIAKRQQRLEDRGIRILH